MSDANSEIRTSCAQLHFMPARLTLHRRFLVHVTSIDLVIACFVLLDRDIHRALHLLPTSNGHEPPRIPITNTYRGTRMRGQQRRLGRQPVVGRRVVP